MRILVVEDDADQRDLIRETLVDHFGRDTVVTAECGHEALDKDLTSFDIILTDFNLPDINGMDFLKAVMAKCDKPVIVVTGENVRQTAAHAIRPGAYDYIVKGGGGGEGRRAGDRGDGRERAADGGACDPYGGV